MLKWLILMAIKFVYHDLIMILSMKVKEKSLSSYLLKIRYGTLIIKMYMSHYNF